MLNNPSGHAILLSIAAVKHSTWAANSFKIQSCHHPGHISPWNPQWKEECWESSGWSRLDILLVQLCHMASFPVPQQKPTLKWPKLIKKPTNRHKFLHFWYLPIGRNTPIGKPSAKWRSCALSNFSTRLNALGVVGAVLGRRASCTVSARGLVDVKWESRVGQLEKLMFSFLDLLRASWVFLMFDVF